MDTLVLSAAYEPMAQISWQRAMVLWAAGKAEVVEEYEDRTIRTVRVEIRMPSVIRFVTALRNRKQKVKFSRQNVYMRDKGRCQFCGDKVPRHQATYDHVVPRSKGGKTTWENVVIACIDCNQRKADKKPSQVGMKLRSKPVRPMYVPVAWGMSVTYRKGMPETWRQYMSDISYWNGELEHDE